MSLVSKEDASLSCENLCLIILVMSHKRRFSLRAVADVKQSSSGNVPLITLLLDEKRLIESHAYVVHYSSKE
jgi:hypothetical protein